MENINRDEIIYIDTNRGSKTQKGSKLKEDTTGKTGGRKKDKQEPLNPSKMQGNISSHDLHSGESEVKFPYDIEAEHEQIISSL